MTTTSFAITVTIYLVGFTLWRLLRPSSAGVPVRKLLRSALGSTLFATTVYVTLSLLAEWSSPVYWVVMVVLGLLVLASIILQFRINRAKKQPVPEWTEDKLS